MAQKTELSVLVLPGGLHSFSAKSPAILPTDNMHLIGANLSMSPSWLPDVNTNVLIEGSLEAKDTIYAGTLYADDGFSGTGAYTNFTIVNGIVTAAS